jgi:hypothetical protein
MSQIDSPSVSQAQLPMVSHPEIAPPASRRAPSVSSRTSRSRHHHRGRSHHGGTSHTPQNEFPFFAVTGDVEVVIACDGLEKRYLLHRLILGQFSGFFEAGMSDEWSRNHIPAPPPPQGALTVIGEDGSEVGQQPPVVRPEHIQAPGRKRWRYELDWANLEEDEEPMLIQKVCLQRVLDRLALTCIGPIWRTVHCIVPAVHSATTSTSNEPVVLPLSRKPDLGQSWGTTAIR